MPDQRSSIISKSKQVREQKDRMKLEVLRALPTDSGNHAVILPPLNLTYTPELLSDKWRFNGFIISNKGDATVVDPGYDFLHRLYASRVKLSQIRRIIVSHKHLDHTASFICLLDCLKRFNQKHKLECFLPEGFYIKHESQLQAYDDIATWKLLYGDNCAFGSYHFRRLFHSDDETYGFKTMVNDSYLGYVSDTGYSIKVKTSKTIARPEHAVDDFIAIVEKHDYLQSFYHDCDIVVANINDLHHNRHSNYHLSGWDALDMFSIGKLKTLILQHLPPITPTGDDLGSMYKEFFAKESYSVYTPLDEGMEVAL